MTEYKSFYKGSEIEEKYKGELKLYGVSTGSKLDEMFYDVDEKGNKKPLNGIPALSVINVVGMPDTGKSILAQQFALTQIKHGKSVLFVSTEAPVRHYYSSIIKKAKMLGIDKELVKEKLYIIDASTDWKLREDINTLIETIRAVYDETFKNNTPVRITIIDSITGLFEDKEFKARNIVRTLYNLMKKYYQTSLFISQKRSIQESDTAESAGGLAIAHIVDGTIVMSKKVINSRQDESLYKMEIGDVLRTLRIDGCRICAHDPRIWVFEITDTGLIDIKMPLSQWIKRNI